MITDRRNLMAGMGAFGLTGLPGLSFARTTFDLGGTTLTTISDGNLVLPRDFMFGDLPEDEVSEILKQHDMPQSELAPPCNITLMQDGTHTILFDAGAGSQFMPSAGELASALDAAGVAPDDVTDVIFTHGHPDHLWGVLDDFDELLFAQASYHMGQTEWDYWSDPDTVDTIGEERASFAVGAARRLDSIEDRCSFFTDGQEVLPGVMAHATFGHTPGHMSFEIGSGNEAAMIVGDAIVNHHVALERPDWPNGSDHNPDQGIETRQRLLDQLATDRIPMIGFHLPGGGMGRIERKDSAYRFIPEGGE